MYDKANTMLIDRRELLRIKVKSYVAEAQIIRQDAMAARARGKIALAEEMTNHRKIAVRGAARHACLALGFIKGRTLDQMEPLNDKIVVGGKVSERKPIHWKSVRDMIARYGTPLMQPALSEAGTDVTKLEAVLNAFNTQRQEKWAEKRRTQAALEEHSRLSQEFQAL